MPSNLTRARLRVKKTARRMIDELKMKGKMEINKSTFRSEMTANEAMVMPMANEPALPTKILPLTLK